MFENIGGKIKTLARVICWIGIIASIISGIILMAQSGQYRYGGGTFVLIGFLVIVFGSLFSWIGSFVLYGYGELIDSNLENKNYLRNIEANGNKTVNLLEQLVNSNGASVNNGAKTNKTAEDNKFTHKETASFCSNTFNSGENKNNGQVNIYGKMFGESEKAQNYSEEQKKNVGVRVYTNKDNKIECPTCGAFLPGDSVRCRFCGQVFMNGQDVPYWCNNCGHQGPYGDYCPQCGSSAKKYNVKLR